MNLPRLDSGDWQLGIAVAVIMASTLLVVRSHRRSRQLTSEVKRLSDPVGSQEAADRRGRRTEDRLTLVMACAAAYLSSTGLRKMGQHVMGLEAPLDWLPFISLDVAAIVCGRRARRRAARGEGPGLSGALMWILVLISSLFSASEAEDMIGAIARAAWPIISGVLFELGSLEERRAQRDAEKRSAGDWIERKLDAVRMLHPVEWARVQLALAADETISQAQATRLVRIERAGYRMYRLRLIKKAYDNHSKRTAWLIAGRLSRANRRAQVTQARVKRDDLEHVVEALQRRVRTMNIATGDYATPQQAQKAVRSLIVIEPRTGSAESNRTAAPASRTGAEVEPNRTGTPGVRTGAAELNRTAPPASRTEPRTALNREPHRESNRTEPEYRTERTSAANHPGMDPRSVRIGTGEPIRTEQVITGTTGGTGTANDNDEGPSDEEIVVSLQRALLPDGKFTHGGTTKIARRFGIGSGRAKRLMDRARELGPTGTETSEANTGEEKEENSTLPVIDLDKAIDIKEILSRVDSAAHGMALASPSAERSS